ncbi:hypothetical protein PAPYR_2241 [Paratrimastix pyriformis]|uniref:Uncharacterized protein n=1 Tax=Paratrimastix pyriformis TaxID=342808 RepID=A0ABQ8UPX5_9EUKA|nr:hypothetical protein PAPYR_2241 [Paratrimastix pyriformis]
MAETPPATDANEIISQMTASFRTFLSQRIQRQGGRPIQQPTVAEIPVPNPASAESTNQDVVTLSEFPHVPSESMPMISPFMEPPPTTPPPPASAEAPSTPTGAALLPAGSPNYDLSLVGEESSTPAAPPSPPQPPQQPHTDEPNQPQPEPAVAQPPETSTQPGPPSTTGTATTGTATPTTAGIATTTRPSLRAMLAAQHGPADPSAETHALLADTQALLAQTSHLPSPTRPVPSPVVPVVEVSLEDAATPPEASPTRLPISSPTLPAPTASLSPCRSPLASMAALGVPLTQDALLGLQPFGFEQEAWGAGAGSRPGSAASRRSGARPTATSTATPTTRTGTIDITGVITTAGIATRAADGWDGWAGAASWQVRRFAAPPRRLSQLSVLPPPTHLAHLAFSHGGLSAADGLTPLSARSTSTFGSWASGRAGVTSTRPQRMPSPPGRLAAAGRGAGRGSATPPPPMIAGGRVHTTPMSVGVGGAESILPPKTKRRPLKKGEWDRTLSRFSQAQEESKRKMEARKTELAQAQRCEFKPTINTKSQKLTSSLAPLPERMVDLLKTAKKHQEGAVASAKEAELKGLRASPDINPASKKLPRTLETLEAWNKQRQEHIKALVDASEKEKSKISFTPTINERSLKLAQRRRTSDEAPTHVRLYKETLRSPPRVAPPPITFQPVINEHSRQLRRPRGGNVHEALYEQGLAQIESKRRADQPPSEHMSPGEGSTSPGGSPAATTPPHQAPSRRSEGSAQHRSPIDPAATPQLMTTTEAAAGLATPQWVTVPPPSQQPTRGDDDDMQLTPAQDEPQSPSEPPPARATVTLTAAPETESMPLRRLTPVTPMAEPLVLIPTPIDQKSASTSPAANTSLPAPPLPEPIEGPPRFDLFPRGGSASTPLPPPNTDQVASIFRSPLAPFPATAARRTPGTAAGSLITTTPFLTQFAASFYGTPTTAAPAPTATMTPPRLTMPMPMPITSFLPAAGPTTPPPPPPPPPMATTPTAALSGAVALFRAAPAVVPSPMSHSASVPPLASYMQALAGGGLPPTPLGLAGASLGGTVSASTPNLSAAHTAATATTGPQPALVAAPVTATAAALTAPLPTSAIATPPAASPASRTPYTAPLPYLPRPAAPALAPAPSTPSTTAAAPALTQPPPVPATIPLSGLSTQPLAPQPPPTQPRAPPQLPLPALPALPGALGALMMGRGLPPPPPPLAPRPSAAPMTPTPPAFGLPPPPSPSSPAPQQQQQQPNRLLSQSTLQQLSMLARTLGRQPGTPS